MSNKTLNISNTNFDEIKQELIAFLESKPEFQGFDFNGSNISILIDLLSYNTYYNNFYLNMMGSEMFLDSAQLRNSVVSHAKMLGYVPSSARGSIAMVDITLNSTDNVNTIVIPKYTKFQSTLDGKTYDFVTNDSFIAEKQTNDSNIFVARNVLLSQGKYFEHRFDVTDPDTQRFIIPNKGVDTSLIEVYVYPDSNETNGILYKNSIDEIDLKKDSEIYFINEAENEKFEVIFGDDVIGKKLSQGNRIKIRYVVSEGEKTNKANNFIYNDSIGYTVTDVTTTSAAGGGSSLESIESIKFNAPKKYQSNNRLVTARDYETLIKNEFPNFQSVQAWGGDENLPPVYGKVFISIKTPTGVVLSNAVKQQIIGVILKSKNIVTITPEIVDPEFVYIRPSVEIIYNLSSSNITLVETKNNVTQVILDYTKSDLEQFSKSFRLSTLLRNIDEVNGVVNSSLSARLSKRIIPQLGIRQNIDINFNTEIKHPFDNYQGSISSSIFSHEGFDDCRLDDFNGDIRIVRTVGDSLLVVNEEVGKVDYTTGIISLINFSIDSFEGEYIDVNIEPNKLDITPKRNQILQINESDINLTMVNEDNLTV